jgi:hypothetical protein
MSDDARAVIASLQPYQPAPDGLDETFHGLYLIEHLSNTDKHRQLTVLLNGLEDPRAIVTHADGRQSVIPWKGAARDGAQIGADPWPTNVDVKVEGEPLVIVRVGEDDRNPGNAELLGSLRTAINTCLKAVMPALVPHVRTRRV